MPPPQQRVDLNRNYTTGWTSPNGGASTSPSSDTYKGPAPFSEPETTAVENFARQHSFTHVCSTHTYQGLRSCAPHGLHPTTPRRTLIASRHLPTQPA